MNWTWRECTACGLKIDAAACRRVDDPQAPFGPELLCPHCENLTVAKYHRGVVFALTLLTAILGYTVGSFLAQI